MAIECDEFDQGGLGLLHGVISGIGGGFSWALDSGALTLQARANHTGRGDARLCS